MTWRKGHSIFPATVSPADRGDVFRRRFAAAAGERFETALHSVSYGRSAEDLETAPQPKAELRFRTEALYTSVSRTEAAD